MRVVHVVPHLNEEASGPSQSVLRLCESLAINGLGVDLHCLAAGRNPRNVSLAVYKQWTLFGQFGFSPGLASALVAANSSVDVIHNHSLWAFPNMAAGLVKRSTGAALVTSPRGTLAPAALARSRLKKSLFKHVQWLTLTRAGCLHATSPMEYQDIRHLGLRQPVAVIPNGIDIPRLAGENISAKTKSHRRLLFLGRLHPIKGVELLLHSWRELQQAHPSWELVIAGKGDSAYVASLQALVKSLGLQRVSFPGTVYGDAKSKFYYSSELFILPTESENFGMTVAEALAHAVPVITTRGAPWSGLLTQQCGWWVERKLVELGASLHEAMQMDPKSLKTMGMRGRGWMARDYDWQLLSRQMADVYRWLRDGGKTPACVKEDA